MLKTIPKTTISARVPVAFANDFKAWAKVNNTTVSEQMQRIFTDVDTNTFLPKVEQINIDDEDKHLLTSVLGGGAMGLLIYKAISAILTEYYPTMDLDKHKMISMGGAAAGAILSGIGLHKIMN